MLHFKRYLRWGALALWMLVFIPLAGEFVIEFVKEKGFFLHPSSKVEAIMNSTLLQAAFLVATGFLVGVWLDWMLAKGVGGHFLNKISLETNNKFTDDPLTRKLDYVENVAFDNKTVEVDNRHFIKCHFKNNCTFKYDGGPFRMDDCTSNKTTHAFGTYNLGIGGAVSILRMIGFVRENAVSSMINVPNYPKL